MMGGRGNGEEDHRIVQERNEGRTKTEKKIQGMTITEQKHTANSEA